VLSFATLIALGTAGLLVLPGLYTGPRLGIVDALFTATSAICVTGLTVVDTATYFTPLGQAWIALLIQLGGLGIVTFATLIIVMLGRRATLGMEEAAGGQAWVVRIDETTLVRAVVVSTLLIELSGASLLWLAWQDDLGAVGAIWPALFHAISAFCNAGFSVFSDNLAGYQRAPGVLLTVAGLIVTGGIGFLVLADLHARYVSRKGVRLGTHTRIVLAVTALLVAGTTLLFLLFESGGELAQLGWFDRAVNALFMAVTPRTAGFNTVEYDAVSNASLFLTIILMVIGGSPGSTAGGIKTSTFALLALAFWVRLRGRRMVSVAGRTIPEETVNRAAGLAVGAMAILTAAIFLLAVVELPAAEDRARFLRLVFEAHSAFGTVGLSMGWTTQTLSALGRLILVALMFVGRVGPLALASAMAFAEGRVAVKYRHPYEDVVIG
jgi:trk system potassium uptake protein TrkH